MIANNTYLLIDDNEIDRLIAEKILEHIYPELHVNQFSNGKEAIKLLIRSIEGGCDFSVPKFIILDLYMPMLDGFLFLNIYKEKIYAMMPNVPILISSHSLRKIDKKKCLSYPFVHGYIEKPFSKEVLLNVTTTLRIKP